jgi:hypothetical protein
MKWEPLLASMLLVMVLVLPANGDTPQSMQLPVASSLAGTKTWEKLSQRVAIDVREQPLVEVIQRLAELTDVEIVVHPQAFDNNAIDGKQRIDLSLEGVSGRSALKLLLEPYQLMFGVLADGRVVVDSEATRHPLSVRTYEVTDLIDDITGPADDETAVKTLKNLRTLIVTTVRPESWDEFGGRGAISVHEQDQSLVVRQSPVHHAETTLLLERLRELRHGRVPPPESTTAAWRLNKRLRETLETSRISLSRHDAPLTTVIRDIAQQAGVNMMLDSHALSDEGVTAETLVTLNVHDKLVVEVLGRLLEPLRLDYVLEDEVVKITSRLQALGEMTVIVYPVGDLADPPADANQAVPREQLDQLARQLQQEIMPNDWDEFGGIGSISPHESTGSLVIRQAEKVHEQIQEWLQAKRTIDQR